MPIAGKIAVTRRVLSRIATKCSDLLGVTPTRAQRLPSNLPLSDPIRDVRRSSAESYSVADVRKYYDERTQGYIEGFGDVFQGARPDSTTELLDYIVEAAQLQDGMTILDAGCGVCGPAIGFAQRRQLKIEALTISAVQVVESQQRINDQGLQDRIRVQQGDFHRLADIYPRDSFDRVLFLESLCHAEDYRKILQQVRQVLKPGGYIYIKDFYAVDHRSRPELLAVQREDLHDLNQRYCLMMPDIPGTVDLLSEIGFDILFMRQPLYKYSPAAWEHFMKCTNQYWIPRLGNPDRVIRAIEFFALNNRAD